MKCPNCHVDLQMTERHQTEVDYCPRCRGIWLDRGELDRIIERASVPARVGNEDRRATPTPEHDNGHRHAGSSASRHKRKSLLGEIFDFD